MYIIVQTIHLTDKMIKMRFENVLKVRSPVLIRKQCHVFQMDDTISWVVGVHDRSVVNKTESPEE